jgi:hypothetical protein
MSRRSRFLVPAVVATAAAASVAALALAGSVNFTPAASTSATAKAATSSSTTYHGCVVGTTRVVEDVFTNKTPTCPSGSFAATWNAQGPAGATGPAGPAGPQGPAGPAGSAGASGQVSITASTNVTNWAESSGWATDQFGRVVNETVQHAADSAKCGGTPQCWFVTGQITDNGTFQTKAGAASPNGSSSAKIAGVLDGTIQGTADFQFYSSSNKLAATNVPTTVNGATSTATTTAWGELGFPSGTTFAGATLTAYGWTYTAASTCETWNDQINPGDDGQGPADGNITGVNACTK